ncbi:MAG: twin-arginine translocase subunit TatC [Acidobacteriota bacterium]
MARSDPDKMTFLEHLEELRARLLVSVLAIFVAFIVCWIYSKPIFAFLAHPVTQFLPPGTKLAFTTLPSAFILYMKVALLAAFFLASPVVILELWRFISPGLYPKERYYAIPFIFFGTAFFVGGGAFGYYFLFPVACRFFLEMGSDFQPIITVDQYLSLISKLLLGVGLVFELPVLIFFLARLGLITHRFLLRNFKYAIVLVFVIAAVVTPTPDIVTQSLFAAPLLVLYALGILVAWAFGKRGKRAD